MSSVTYEYQKPQNTYTLDQYIACKSDTLMCYANTSFNDYLNDGDLCQTSYNVVSDYIDELRDDEYCLSVELTDEQLTKYKYRPKLLCYDIYGNTELYFIILLINDMYSTKQFTKKKLLMPTAESMKLISSRIINANRTAMEVYNKKSKENI
jgi:hypothetical protein